jgi:hypothetical protein
MEDIASLIAAQLPAPGIRGPRQGHQLSGGVAGKRMSLPNSALGETGNTVTVDCHLHFQIHVHGVPVNPEPRADALGSL